jgi:nitrite reductase/ring-hydroxylating ferredoxin subunit
MAQINVPRRNLLIGAGASTLLTFIPFKAFAQGPTAICSRAGQKIIFKGKNYLCVKNNGKLGWQILTPAKPTILVHPTSTPTPVASTPAAQPSAKPSESAKSSPVATPSPAPAKINGFIAAKLSELKEGESKVVMVKDLKGATVGVALFLSNGVVTAHSSICTHQGCTVGESGKQLACPCHGSVFDGKSGAVVNGPAGSPLRTFKVVEAAGEIYIVADN